MQQILAICVIILTTSCVYATHKKSSDYLWPELDTLLYNSYDSPKYNQQINSFDNDDVRFDNDLYDLFDDQVLKNDRYGSDRAYDSDRYGNGRSYEDDRYDDGITKDDIKAVLETAYLDAMLKSLHKRAEPPVKSSTCQERSNIQEISSTESKVTIRFPGIYLSKPDQYMCTSIAVPFDGKASYVVDYVPHAGMEKAHHLLVFGCEGVRKDAYWNCGMGKVCADDSKRHTLWAWARNAPGLKLPKDVGFEIGKSAKINYIVLQIHYAHAFQPGETDCSGVTFDVTTQSQKYLAGIFLMGASQIFLPAHSQNVSVDAACVNYLPSPIKVFAFRTHTHMRGNVVTGLRYRDNQFKMIGKGNPKWPESFYPRVGGSIDILPNDRLYMECVYSNPLSHSVHVGATGNDEMCNFYMMYYTSDRSVIKMNTECWDIELLYRKQLTSVKLPSAMHTLAPFPGFAGEDSIQAILSGRAKTPKIPPEHIHGAMHHHDANDEDDETGDSAADADGLEENLLELQNFIKSQSENSDEESASSDASPHSDASSKARSRGHGYKETPNSIEDIQAVPDWLSIGSEVIGQVGGIGIDDRGYIHVFHRGDRKWNQASFNDENVFNQQSQPILVDTVFKLDPDTGSLVNKWGGGQFYMPHGANVDRFNNLWLTDVAMHQVMKYPLDGANEPLMVLGEKFVPGNDQNHFCKPTSTAVDVNGYLYVADGYCNGRVVKYNSSGHYITEWGKMADFKTIGNSPPGYFFIVHSIILTHNDTEVWVADRENGRIQCFDSNGKLLRIIQDKKNIGSKIFALSFSSNKGGLIHGINGPYLNEVVEGFTIDMNTHELVNKWGNGLIAHPHAIGCFHDGSQMFVGQLEGTEVIKYVNNDVQLPEEDTVVFAGGIITEKKSAIKETSAIVNNEVSVSSQTTSNANNEDVGAVDSSDEESDAVSSNEPNNDVTKMSDDAADASGKVATGGGDDVVKNTVSSTGPIAALIAVLLVVPSLVILAGFACFKMRQKRLKEYHGLLARGTSVSKFSDKEKKSPSGKPSINLGKFFRKSEVDKTGFSRVRTEADSDDEASDDSDVELFKKKPEDVKQTQSE